MTVAPRALASTAANTRTEAGRSRPEAVLRATTMLQHNVANDVADCFADNFANDLAEKTLPEPVMAIGFGRGLHAGHGVRRRGLHPTRTVGSDSGKPTTSSSVMRRGPFHHHHQPARLPNRPRPSTHPHPAERRPVVPFRDPRNRRDARAPLARAVRCYRLYGDIMVKSAPDRKLFSARTCGGQRGNEKSICDPELDIEQHA